MPHFCFTSNFAYSSNGMHLYDVDPISLVKYQDVADLENNGLTVLTNPSLDAVSQTFEDLKLGRKQTKAILQSDFDENINPVLNDQTIHGFINLTAFSPESVEDTCIAFSTDNNGQVMNFCARPNGFKNPKRSEGNSISNSIKNRHTVTANNCVHFPDLSKAIGVPVIFAQADQTGQYDETKLIKYPKKDQSSYVQTTSGRYPDILPAGGINEHHHISMVSSDDSYYYTRGSGGSNALRVVKIPYKASLINANANNNSSVNFSEFLIHLAPTFASSTMWVTLANELFIAHGDRVFIVNPVLPERKVWADSSFVNPIYYSITQPSILTYTYTIERAVYHKKTNRHFALCSRTALGAPHVVDPNTQYFCELTFNNVAGNNTVFVTELNSTPIPINATSNKQINIPIFADYAVFVCDDPSITCCDLTNYSLKPITAFMEFTDGAFRSATDVEVVSVTQPTIDSSSNYLTTKRNTRYYIWKLKNLPNNLD